MYEEQFMDNGVLDEVGKSDFEINGIGGYLTISEISDVVLTQLYYDKWDGILPEILAGDGVDILLTPND